MSAHSPKLSRKEVMNEMDLATDDELSALLTAVGKEPDKKRIGQKTMEILREQKTLLDGIRLFGEEWPDTPDHTMEDLPPKEAIKNPVFAEMMRGRIEDEIERDSGDIRRSTAHLMDAHKPAEVRALSDASL